MRVRKLLLVAAVATTFFTDSVTYAEPNTDEIKQLVISRAVAHGVKPDTLLCVVNRESRFQPSARGSRNEYGLAQWLPGRGNAWDYTLAASQGIDIFREYQKGNPDAAYFDADGIAQLFARGRAYRIKHWGNSLRYCE